MCQSLRLPVDYRNIRKSDADLAELMRRAPSAKTVPQIFAGDRLIGGYADLEAAAARGELAQLLTD